jgi:tetratricopeptide (TPR) repeat protein
VAAARDAIRLGAFADALRHLAPVLDFDARHAEALRLRAEALEALGDPAAVAAYRAAADAAEAPASDDLRAKAALAQVKQGDPKGALEALRGVQPASVEGRLAEALAYSGAAALGFGDPAIGTRKAAESRRLALETGDKAAIVVASWAQAAAAHARGELHSSVWDDLQETQHVPDLAVRVFDGHLCITQRFLYGARPYRDVIAFADSIAAEGKRIGAARGHAFGVTLRGEAELLSGNLDAAEADLVLGGKLHRAIGGATGEALSLQRRAELALHQGRRAEAGALLDEALDLARQTDIGFHLLDRIYGTRIALAEHPQAALAALEEAQESVRGNLETCPGCRITFAVPATIAAARAGRLDLASAYEPAVEYLANVVMRLPAWHAALEEVRGHLALARGHAELAPRHFTEAADRFAAAGHPLDCQRCRQWAARTT